ncbi:MAG: CAP domain-containing protein [Ichthyobacteriaceae bacterium]|nr:CAP domain-containing protein [Ichthyobacteriaceae bacterium]
MKIKSIILTLFLFSASINSAYCTNNKLVNTTNSIIVSNTNSRGNRTIDNVSFYKRPTIADTINTNDFRADMLVMAINKRLNEIRVTQNLKEFRLTMELTDAANFHSEQMYEHNFFGHFNNFSKGNETLLDRILKFDGNYPFIAENISDVTTLATSSNQKIIMNNASGEVKYYNERGVEIINHTYISLAKKIINGWMKSKVDRSDILNPDLFETGIGAVLYEKKVGEFKYYHVLVTQTLGGY